MRGGRGRVNGGEVGQRTGRGSVAGGEIVWRVVEVGWSEKMKVGGGW